MDDKQNKYQIILLASVIVCAIFTFVTIAWAAFSTTLKISGTATIKSQSWNVYWSAASVDTTNSTTVSASIDSIGSSTSTITLSSLAAEYNVPGQKAVYNLSITNGGTFDAKYVQYTAPTISCTDDGGTTTYNPTNGLAAYNTAVSTNNYTNIGAASVCAFMTYELKVKNPFTGTTTTSVASGTDFTTLANSLVLDKSTSSGVATGGVIDLELTIYFDKNKDIKAEALPTKDVSVTISNLQAKFDQA